MAKPNSDVFRIFIQQILGKKRRESEGLQASTFLESDTEMSNYG